MHTVAPSEGEHEVYRVIIEEFCRICELYYNSTGDTKRMPGSVSCARSNFLSRPAPCPT